MAALAALRQPEVRPIDSLPDVNRLVSTLDPARRRPFRTPLHSYFGAHLAIDKKLRSRRAPDEVRGFSHLDKLDHVVCWLFSDWYPPYNALSKACGAGDLRRLLEVGDIATRSLHERVLAWQMLKAQVAHGVRVTLTRSPSLAGLESRTVFLPHDVSTTVLYNAGDVVDTELVKYKKQADPVNWDTHFHRGLSLNGYEDLYSPACLEAVGLGRVGEDDLRGLGVPDQLLPLWWYETATARVAVCQ